MTFDAFKLEIKEKVDIFLNSSDEAEREELLDILTKNLTIFNFFAAHLGKDFCESSCTDDDMTYNSWFNIPKRKNKEE